MTQDEVQRYSKPSFDTPSGVSQNKTINRSLRWTFAEAEVVDIRHEFDCVFKLCEEKFTEKD